ncbi:hypothetical protein [Vulgatibacter sp.]|uniref:hypothetical protein n=1 Tax=Vulgatibacter sp. TaxID=1971226 RepID=UPI003569612E
MRFAIRVLLPCLLLAGCLDFGGDEDECAFDDDCGPDAWCHDPFLFGGTECRDYLGEGDRCNDGVDECHPDLRCNLGYKPDRCMPPGRYGQPCDSAWDCADEEALCNPGSRSEGRFCTEPGSVVEGGSCSTRTTAVCADGRVCVQRRCVDPAAEGEACPWGVEGTSIACAEGLACTEAGICERLTSRR